MMIFKVTENRFYEEWRIRVQMDEKKEVEWFVDEQGILNMYIINDRGYGYFYSTPSKELPERIKIMLRQSKRGMTLGILEPRKETVDESVSVVEELRKSTLTAQSQ